MSGDALAMKITCFGGDGCRCSAMHRGIFGD